MHRSASNLQTKVDEKSTKYLSERQPMELSLKMSTSYPLGQISRQKLSKSGKNLAKVDGKLIRAGHMPIVISELALLIPASLQMKSNMPAQVFPIRKEGKQLWDSLAVGVVKDSKDQGKQAAKPPYRALPPPETPANNDVAQTWHSEPSVTAFLHFPSSLSFSIHHPSSPPPIPPSKTPPYTTHIPHQQPTQYTPTLIQKCPPSSAPPPRPVSDTSSLSAPPPSTASSPRPP